jgi:hypothetical protein
VNINGLTSTELCERLNLSFSSLCYWIRFGKIKAPPRSHRTGRGQRGCARLWRSRDVAAVKALMAASTNKRGRWRLE